TAIRQRGQAHWIHGGSASRCRVARYARSGLHGHSDRGDEGLEREKRDDGSIPQGSKGPSMTITAYRALSRLIDADLGDHYDISAISAALEAVLASHSALV